MKEILVLCPFSLDAGLISKAASMASQVRVLVPEGEADRAAQYGATHIYELIGTVSDEADFSRFLEEQISSWQSSVVLAPADVQMRNIMPQLAWHLKAGLTADCTALEMKDGGLLQTRPAFGNSLMADIESLSPVQMATVRPGTFRPESRDHVTEETVLLTYAPTQSRVQLESFEPFSQGKALTQADIILAGGLGIGSKEGFQKLRQLAQKLGAAVGASRSAVDAGFAPYSCQIGMTGVTVCPKLYIAVGISGAVQHLAGMSGSQKIIAINTDPKAPIFDYADYGIVGNWEEVIDRIIEIL